VTPGGTITRIIDATGDGTTPLWPSIPSIATDPEDNLYIASAPPRLGNLADAGVFKVTPFGEISRVVDASGDGTTPLTSPFSLAADACYLYVGDSMDTVIFRLALMPTNPRCADPIAVDVDIKPGGDSSPINLMSRGLIPVALLGSASFEVTEVDVSTLAFGPGAAGPAHKRGGHTADLNDDGFENLLSHYRIQESAIAINDTEACVTGELFDGARFEGCDTIRTVPACGLGFELGLLLPPLMALRRKSARG
jgi:hypothetical protein